MLPSIPRIDPSAWNIFPEIPLPPVMIVIASLAIMHFGHSMASSVVGKAVSKQAAVLSSI